MIVVVLLCFAAALLAAVGMMRIAVGAIGAHRRDRAYVALRSRAEHVWAMERELGWEPWPIFGFEVPKIDPKPVRPSLTVPSGRTGGGFVGPQYLVPHDLSGGGDDLRVRMDQRACPTCGTPTALYSELTVHDWDIESLGITDLYRTQEYERMCPSCHTLIKFQVTFCCRGLDKAHLWIAVDASPVITRLCDCLSCRDKRAANAQAMADAQRVMDHVTALSQAQVAEAQRYFDSQVAINAEAVAHAASWMLRTGIAR